MRLRTQKVKFGVAFTAIAFVVVLCGQAFNPRSSEMREFKEVVYPYSDEEIEHLEKASEFTDCRDALTNLRYKHDLVAAVEECNSALKINPRNGGAYATRAYAKFYMNDINGTREDFTEAIKLEPKRSVFYLGRAKTDNNNLEDLDKAIQINPTRAFYYQSRANAKCLRHDFFGALVDYFHAIRLEPSAYFDCVEDSQYYANHSISNLHKPYKLL